MQQADGEWKLRPCIVLRVVPPFGDAWLCAVSTQLKNEVAGIDEVIGPEDADFGASGLKQRSLIRVLLLNSVASADIHGRLGAISRERHARLLRGLVRFLDNPSFSV